jgi:hypothetical protein
VKSGDLVQLSPSGLDKSKHEDFKAIRKLGIYITYDYSDDGPIVLSNRGMMTYPSVWWRCEYLDEEQ